MATAAVIVTTTSYWLMLGVDAGAPGHVITSGSNESTTAQLSDGSGLSLGASSTVRVNVTPEQRVTHLLNGEAMFDVVQDSARPFVVKTPRVDVTALRAKFHVAVHPSVEIKVFDGDVLVSERGSKAGLRLKKGESFRVSVDESKAALADNRDNVGFDAERQYCRALLGFDEKIISMYACDLSARRSGATQTDQGGEPSPFT